jgi:hypothetical protein
MTMPEGDPYQGAKHASPAHSPMSDPKLPPRVNQGDAGHCKYPSPVRGRNGQNDGAGTASGNSSGGRIAKPDNTPGRGTRGHGTTHENIGRGGEGSGKVMR